MRTKASFFFRLLILGSIFLFGCGGDGDDDDLVVPQVGAITINMEPDSISAPWQIVGPGGFSQSGTGDHSFADLAAGNYTLTCGTVAGWTTPNPAVVTQPLTTGTTLTFTATYVVEAGTITIDPEPNTINAPWQITGPGGFSQSGTGDEVLPNMSVGSYTVTWGAVAGWTTPNPAVVTQSLTAGATPTFAATYVVQTGTITIDPGPNTINAYCTWQITGPGGFSQSGIGDAALTDMAVGGYTLTWGLVGGWTRPSPAVVTQTLAWRGVVTFAGLYLPVAPTGYVVLPAGTFLMGSPTNEPLRSSDETQHQVTLTRGIFVKTTEVTNEQYRYLAQWAYDRGYVTATSASLSDNLDGSTQELLDLDGDCEISFSGRTFTVDAGKEFHPVLDVTWYGAAAYCDWLSLAVGSPRAYDHSNWQCNAGNPYAATGYRLPTEAEWEYACRSGTQTPFNTGSCLNAANYNGEYPYTGCPAGPFVGWTRRWADAPPAFGLYDMHGNLAEWCNDWLDSYGGTVTDPVGAGAGPYRAYRGGAWNTSEENCRSANRGGYYPTGSYYSIGFRVVRTAY